MEQAKEPMQRRRAEQTTEESEQPTKQTEQPKKQATKWRAGKASIQLPSNEISESGSSRRLEVAGQKRQASEVRGPPRRVWRSVKNVLTKSQRRCDI